MVDFNQERQYFVRDPEAFKLIAIKGFDHFEDRREFLDENIDEMWGASLVSLRGKKWRQMRATLSPAFTGSKMRQMFELVSECADGIAEHFTKKAESGERLDVEMKDLFSRYGNDVIATCAFGIKVDSFANPDNAFFTNGKNLLSPTSFKSRVLLLIALFLPKLARVFKVKFVDESLSSKFKSMILDTIKIRQLNNIRRPDMIDLMMQLRNGRSHNQIAENAEGGVESFASPTESNVDRANIKRTWSDNEVVAQCLIFFLAGFDTISIMSTFVAYELMVNQDVQQKLYEEIITVNQQLDGKRITYDVLQKMKYLDQVVCETLRKWPAGVQIDRMCVKDYIYDDGNRHFKIEKGACINFSVFSVQRDPNFFPNPDVFDPERFSDENKCNIVSGTYVPFGVGPRNCIGKFKTSIQKVLKSSSKWCLFYDIFAGSRFALMELKIIFYYLLLNFSFERNHSTQIPLKFKKDPSMNTENGVHLELKPRKIKLNHNKIYECIKKLNANNLF